MAKWFDSGSLYEFLRDAGVDKFLSIDETEEFLVEVVFLDHWNAKNGNLPDEEGITVEAHFHPDGTEVTVRITCDTDDTVEAISLIYTPSKENLGKHALEICIGENLVYSREAEHNPATEWSINGLANDLTDEDGNFVFVGEPTNI